MRNLQAAFDPLATKGPRDFRKMGNPSTHPHSPGSTMPGGFGVPKKPKKKRGTYKKYKSPTKRFLRPVPRPKPILRPKPSGHSVPNVKPLPVIGPRPIRFGNPILMGASILGEIFSYEPLLGLGGPANPIQFTWDDADTVTFCPWAGDGVSPAFGRVPITRITAEFNCGIFDFPDPSVLPGPRTGVNYELWHDCTLGSPAPYNLFPGELGSIIIVFNDLLPPDIPLEGAVEVSQFITDPGAVTATLPFEGGMGDDGHGVGGDGPPYTPVPPQRYSVPSGIGPERHIPRKPGKNEVEGKPSVPRKTFEKFGRSAANYVSEINDFISAVFDAMPRSAQFNQGVRPGDPDFNSIFSKANAVFNYMKSGEAGPGFLGQAVKNVIANEVEDRAFGAIGRAGRKAVRGNPYWRSPVGLQAGGRYRPYATVRSN